MLDGGEEKWEGVPLDVAIFDVDVLQRIEIVPDQGDGGLVAPGDRPYQGIAEGIRGDQRHDRALDASVGRLAQWPGQVGETRNVQIGDDVGGSRPQVQRLDQLLGEELVDGGEACLQSGLQIERGHRFLTETSPESVGELVTGDRRFDHAHERLGVEDHVVHPPTQGGDRYGHCGEDDEDERRHSSYPGSGATLADGELGAQFLYLGLQLFRCPVICRHGSRTF